MTRSQQESGRRRKTRSRSLANIAAHLRGLPNPTFIQRLEGDLTSSLSEPMVDAAVLREMAKRAWISPEGRATRN